MTTLAIDPGSITGYAHSDGTNGVWTLGGDMGAKASALRSLIIEFARHHDTLRIITEGGYPISRKGAAQLEWLRGAVQMAAVELGAPVVVVAPASLKAFACSNGHADKEQMMRACRTVLNVEPQDSNHADAIWLLEYSRHPIPVGQSERRRVKRAAKKAPKLF